MIPEIARLVVAAALLVALPGFLLVQAAFPPPRSRLSWTERASVGVALGLLPHGERGFFQTAATGVPFVEVAMVLVCLGLLKVGLDRGAYPALAARLPRTNSHSPQE
jgi:uncharacterized membrane protein